MTWLIGALVAKGISERCARALVVALLTLVAATIAIAAFQLWLNGRERAALDRHDAQMKARIERTTHAADQQLNQRQTEAAAAASAARQEFDNATRHLPAEGLTRRQRLDLCNELRNAGADSASLAQCSDVQD